MTGQSMQVIEVALLTSLRRASSRSFGYGYWFYRMYLDHDILLMMLFTSETLHRIISSADFDVLNRGF